MVFVKQMVMIICLIYFLLLVTENSAPKYLIDLYKSFLDEDSGNLKINSKAPVVIEGEVLSNNSLHAINDSDIIMSFVNQSKC